MLINVYVFDFLLFEHFDIMFENKESKCYNNYSKLSVVSSAVEHSPYTRRVIGSNPLPRTTF